MLYYWCNTAIWNFFVTASLYQMACIRLDRNYITLRSSIQSILFHFQPPQGQSSQVDSNPTYSEVTPWWVEISFLSVQLKKGLIFLPSFKKLRPTRKEFRVSREKKSGKQKEKTCNCSFSKPAGQLKPQLEAVEWRLHWYSSRFKHPRFNVLPTVFK